MHGFGWLKAKDMSMRTYMVRLGARVKDSEWKGVVARTHGLDFYGSTTWLVVQKDSAFEMCVCVYAVSWTFGAPTKPEDATHLQVMAAWILDIEGWNKTGSRGACRLFLDGRCGDGSGGGGEGGGGSGGHSH